MRTILVTGANRGLGFEFTRQFVKAGDNVIATCRYPQDADELIALAERSTGTVSLEQLDVTQPQSVSALAIKYKGEPVDILVNNAGLLGPNPIIENFPRQHFGTMDYELWAELLRINTFGPVRMAEAFMTNISNSHERKIVCLSSSVGSIESRRTPAISYPSTKAALNKTVSLISDQLKNQGIICVSICPGHVKTRMGVGGAELEIEDSVSGMRGVIEGLTLADSGTFIRYNGERVPW